MKNTAIDLTWKKVDSFVGNSMNPALTGHRPCPVCGSLHSQVLYVFDEFQFFTDSATVPKRAKLEEVQCKLCHAIYLNPCYTSAGFSYLFAEAGQSYGATEGRPNEQVGWLEKRGLLDQGKVFLDAGCYDGRFLAGLPATLRRVGVDLDAPAIGRGQTKYGADGVELIHGAFESFHCPVAPDVISMFHVLEHLANPLDVLRHLRLISHNQTKLVVEVPVVEHGKTNDINGFLSAQHMTHFSIRSLENVLNRAGWVVIEACQMSEYNGHRVLAKPSEVVEKVIGNVNDKITMSDYFSHWHGNLAAISRRLQSWDDVPRMVIWGGGMHTEFLYQVTSLFQQDAQREYIIVDSDPLKQGRSWRGVPIFHPNVLKDLSWEKCRLVISSYGSQEVILLAAQSLQVPRDRIGCLYDQIDAY